MKWAAPIYPNGKDDDMPPSPQSPPKLSNAWENANNPLLQAPAMASQTPSMISSSCSSTVTAVEIQSNDARSMLSTFRWLAAIHEATQCLRQANVYHSQRYCPSIEETDYAVHYLVMLERLLGQHEIDWDKEPTFDPPQFVSYKDFKVASQMSSKKKKKKKGTKVEQSPTSVTTWESYGWNLDTFKHNGGDSHCGTSHNRFAVFRDDDLDGTTGGIGGKDDAFSLLEMETCLEEGGDIPVLNRRGSHLPDGNTMSMRRIVIRIVTAQSELFACQGRSYRRDQSWALGAQSFHHSLWKINQGLEFANVEVSRCLVSDGLLRGHRQGLMEDANIVEVAVKALTKEREAFLQLALAKKHKLMQQIAQNELSRNLARMRMGDELWFSNKSGKSEAARLREKQERECVEVGSALNQLVQVDTRSAVQSTIKLKLRLENAKECCSHRQPSYDRHNKARPSFSEDRIDSSLYPDPSLFGWEFTGSNEQGKVEFFEKQGMLLDWHYATAEMKLSWMRMIGSGSITFYQSNGPVSSAFYMEVLQSAKTWEVANRKKGKTDSRIATISPFC